MLSAARRKRKRQRALATQAVQHRAQKLARRGGEGSKEEHEEGGQGGSRTARDWFAHATATAASAVALGGGGVGRWGNVGAVRDSAIQSGEKWQAPESPGFLEALDAVVQESDTLLVLRMLRRDFPLLVNRVQRDRMRLEEGKTVCTRVAPFPVMLDTQVRASVHDPTDVSKEAAALVHKDGTCRVLRLGTSTTDTAFAFTTDIIEWVMWRAAQCDRAADAADARIRAELARRSREAARRPPHAGKGGVSDAALRRGAASAGSARREAVGWRSRLAGNSSTSTAVSPSPAATVAVPGKSSSTSATAAASSSTPATVALPTASSSTFATAAASSSTFATAAASSSTSATAAASSSTSAGVVPPTSAFASSSARAAGNAPPRVDVGATKKQADACRREATVLRAFVQFLPKCRDVQVTEATLRSKLLGFAADTPRILVKHGLLVRSTDNAHLASYWFSVPQSGLLMTSLSKGRAELLRVIKATRYSEISRRALLKRKLRTSVLGMQFHIQDAIGSGTLRSFTIGSGTFLAVNM